MKLKKRKTSKVWKEVLETVEAFKDNPEYAPILTMFRYILLQRMVVLLNFILVMMKKEKYEKHLIHLKRKTN